MSTRRRLALIAMPLGLSAGIAFTPIAQATATAEPAPAPAEIEQMDIAPGFEEQAKDCAQLWIPYGQQIDGKWYAVGAGRLADCGSTYFMVTLQQNRAWGPDDRDTKTITHKGDTHPKAQCQDFGEYDWRTVGNWYRYKEGGKIETLGTFITKWQRLRC